MASEILTKKLTNFFNMYDVDGSNFLEEKDFVEAVTQYCNHLGIPLDSPEGIELRTLELKFWDAVKGFDTDGDEKVNVDEFVKGWETLHTQGKLENILKEYVDNIVKRLDKDGDGQLSPEEFALFTNSDQGLEIFKKLDVDGSGHLSKDEIAQHLIVYCTSDNPSDPGNSLFGFLD